MAERKSAPSSSGARKSPAKASARPGAKPPVKAPASAGQGRPPAKKPGKSIVNQKQTPWGLIVTAIVIVVFAATVITVAVANHKTKKAANGGCGEMLGSNATTYLNELKCAADIQGVTFKAEPNRNHKDGTLSYDATPPVGGDHSPYWADCTGTVYPNAIANENAVHALEHGAVWITYKPTLDAGQIATLTSLVNGHDRLMMSPYPGLTTNISVQSWGYQLKVDSASDPRIQTFITDLAYNQKTTPEYGATCSQPTFKANPSTFGHPLSDAVSGGAGSTMP